MKPIIAGSLLCLVGIGVSSPLRAQDEVVSETYTGALYVLTTEVVSAVAGATTRTLDRIEKQVLAQAVLEDAAHYYDVGELGGVLPAVIARVRELDPVLASASDAAVVQALVSAAVAFAD
jgi:hypothetical protein